MEVWEKELLVTPTVQALYHSNKQETHVCPLDGSKYIWGYCWGLHCFTTDFTFIHLRGDKDSQEKA